MPLGVEDQRIPNGHMSASSFYNTAYVPRYGRLNSVKSWRARTNNRKQYLQIYLGGLEKITGIETQGQKGIDYWVKKFYVSFSNDGHTFTNYKEKRRIKVCVVISLS